MLHHIRYSGLTRVLAGFLALFLLNISVDAPDANPDHIPEDLTYNDPESIVEIVVEGILGFENAIAEYDDPDTDEHHSRKIGKTKVDLTLAYVGHHVETPTLNRNKHNPLPTPPIASGYVSLELRPPQR